MEMATISIPYQLKADVEDYLQEIGSNWTEFLMDTIGTKMSKELERVLIDSEKEGNHQAVYSSAEEMLADLLSECDDV